MKVYTAPPISDLTGAVERLPIPPADGSTTAAATGTQGAPQAGAGRSKSVSSPSAETGNSSRSIGSESGAESVAQPLAIGGNTQGKTLSGRERARVRHVGLEPTTR